MSRRVGYIHPSAIIGEPAECRADEPDAGWYIDKTATIEALATVDSGTFKMTRIDADAWIFKHAHVGHDAHVMEGAEIATGAVIGGHAIIGPGARIGLNATILPYRVIGQRARIGAGAVVTKDVPPGETWAGNPARKLEDKPRPLTPPEWYINEWRQVRLASTTTSPATNTASSRQASRIDATAACAEAWEYLASQGTSKRSTTPAPVRVSRVGFIDPKAQPAPLPADSAS